MATSVTPLSVQHEVSRIRHLSREGRHRDALAAAEALALESPTNRDALYLMAANLRSLNRISEALQTLQALELHHPRYSLLHQERGCCRLASRDIARAIEAFGRAVNLNPALIQSWTMLESLYRLAGEPKNAAVAAEQISKLQKIPAEIVRAGSLYSDGDLDAAEAILRNSGTHVEALRLLGRIAHRRGALNEAEQLLKAALESAPDYLAAGLDYARVLIDAQKYFKAQRLVTDLLDRDPANSGYISLAAATSAGLGQHERALDLYTKLIADSPESCELYVARGHSLKSLGRIQEAVESYKASSAAWPGFGDAWWSLANLKSYRFTDDELARLRLEEESSAERPVDRIHLCFSLGKAYEDRAEFAESWRFYERGNALMRAETRYDPEVIETSVRKQIEACSAEFFRTRTGAGAPSRDPIFIVGLPRSGSTLIEQILASHSRVEGTQELPEIPRIAQELEGSRGDSRNADRTPSPYPASLANLAPQDLHRLGERYLSDSRVYRGAKPLFIDKMPNNFRHIGLIHLILPNATIIDVRRDPVSCCFSNLKQLFASGQEFTYGVEDIARYYRAYLELMWHWDAVLAGRVLHVFYEDVVEDLEKNVRRILEFCGLEFEPGCLEFYKTQRSVRTPSSEQVRRPIFRDGLDQWRNYEPWLGPLKDALGDALSRYRE